MFNMKKFFKWIKSVFIGWYNVLTNHMSDEAKARYEICKKCEKNIKIGKVHICSECGCVLPQKCASPKEKCLMNKW